jgi:hypothetical protein
MKRVAFTFLWAGAAWYLSQILFGSFAAWALFAIPPELADLTLTMLPILGYVSFYGVPVLFLTLGMLGKLPGTAR